MTLRRYASAGCVAALLLSTPLPTAEAIDTATADSAADMRVVSIRSGEPVGPAQPAAERADGDIVAVKFSSLEKVVRAKIELRELTPTDLIHVVVRVDGQALTRVVHLGAWDPLWEGHAIVLDGEGNKVPCRPTWDLDYGGNSVVIELDRACIGRPSSARIGIAVETATPTRVFVDDAFRSGEAEPFKLPALGATVVW